MFSALRGSLAGRASINKAKTFGWKLVMDFDNEIIRKILQCVIVETKDRIKVVFIGGFEVETEMEQ